jgi:formylglycine-generating enzyme required for sulfatase activity
LIASGVADDVSLLGVRDLGGNVAEWVAGKGAAYDAACFEPEAQLLFDPRCDDPAYLDVARGGHWHGTLGGARATSRAVHAQGSVSVGFRCARSDSPAR